jgi:hypothetical protein
MSIIHLLLFPIGLLTGLALAAVSVLTAVKVMTALTFHTSTQATSAGPTLPMPFVIKNEDMEKQVEDENIRAFPRMEKFDNVDGLGR